MSTINYTEFHDELTFRAQTDTLTGLKQPPVTPQSEINWRNNSTKALGSKKKMSINISKSPEISERNTSVSLKPSKSGGSFHRTSKSDELEGRMEEMRQEIKVIKEEKMKQIERYQQESQSQAETMQSLKSENSLLKSAVE